MRRIEIISNLFSPDQFGGAALYTDMARYFQEACWRVEVTTTFSYYPAWKLNEEDKNCLKRVDLFEGSRITRLKIFVPSQPGGMTRILSDLSFLFSLLLNAAGRSREGNAVITACPMLAQSCFAKLVDLKRYGPTIIVVQDIASEAAGGLGILKGKVFLGMIQWIEEWCLASCHVLSSIAPQMVETLQRRLGDRSNTPMVFTPNWIHKSLADEIKRQIQGGRISREGRRLFYAWNLGVKQALHEFAYVFADKSLDRWKLEIRGNGAMRQQIFHLSESCERISVGLPLPEVQYVSCLLSCTACLITQPHDGGDSFFASKILPALAAGTPVLVVGDTQTPLACFVRDLAIGEVVELSLNALQDVLEKWEQNPALLESYSSNALKLSKDYTREKVLDRYRRLIESKYHDERSMV